MGCMYSSSIVGMLGQVSPAVNITCLIYYSTYIYIVLV